MPQIKLLSEPLIPWLKSNKRGLYYRGLSCVCNLYSLIPLFCSLNKGRQALERPAQMNERSRHQA
jgi:hypothetical protein